MGQSLKEIRRVGRARRALETAHQETMRRIDRLSRVYQQPAAATAHAKAVADKEHRAQARMLTDQLRP